MSIEEKADAFVREHKQVYDPPCGLPDALKALEKNAFRAGYKQSLIDNAYDWEDIRQIVIVSDELANEWGTAKMENEGQKTFYEEVLKRFHIKKECGF